LTFLLGEGDSSKEKKVLDSLATESSAALEWALTCLQDPVARAEPRPKSGRWVLQTATWDMSLPTGASTASSPQESMLQQLLKSLASGSQGNGPPPSTNTLGRCAQSTSNWAKGPLGLSCFQDGLEWEHSVQAAEDQVSIKSLLHHF
jgi:hypothetical protein